MPMINGQYRRAQLRNGNINYRFGWFFVTFQVAGNKSELGAIVGESCVLNALGKAVQSLIETLPKFNPEVFVDSFVVMPNHVHLIIKIEEDGQGATARGTTPQGATPLRPDILGARGCHAPPCYAPPCHAPPCHAPPEKAPVISTFTSPQERAVLRRLIAQGRRFVAVYPGGLPAVLPPEIAARVEAGAALLLSPVDTLTGVNKQRAIWCNEYVIRKAETVWCGYIKPGGTLEAILNATSNALS